MIVDASLLLLLELSHGDSPVERDRLRSVLVRANAIHPFRAPALIAYELGNAIHRKRVRESTGTLKDRQAQVRLLLGLVQPVPPGSATLEIAGQTTEKESMSFYDASYVALALAQGERFLTADRRLHARALAQHLTSYLLPQDLARLEADFPETHAPA